MIALKNGCSRSEIKVIPSNWDTDISKASDKPSKAVKEKLKQFTRSSIFSENW
jgi:hypothetical protein